MNALVPRKFGTESILDMD